MKDFDEKRQDREKAKGKKMYMICHDLTYGKAGRILII